MKFSLKQLLGIVTFLAVMCGVCTTASGMMDLAGRVFIGFGVLIFLIAHFFQMPIREHVPNDREIRFMSSLFGFGLSGSIWIFGGVTLMTRSLLAAFAVTVGVFVIHYSALKVVDVSRDRYDT